MPRTQKSYDLMIAKAKELQSLLKDLEKLAEENDYGIDMDCPDMIKFEDWQSSSCYGEADDSFSVDRDGNVWESSFC